MLAMGKGRQVSDKAACVITHVASAPVAGSGTKRRGATGGESADDGADASVAATGDSPAKKAKDKSKTGAAGSGSCGGGSRSGGSGGGADGSTSSGGSSSRGGDGGASGAGAATRSTRAKADE